MLINLRNALMTGKRLPYDAEVEYLESTRTQYVDTGIMLTSNHVVRLRGMRVTGTGSQNSFFGSNESSAKFFCLTGGSNVDRFYFFNSMPRETSSVADTFRDYECGKNFAIDEVQIGSPSSYTGAATANAYVFARNNGTSANDFIRGRIAYLQIYNNGVLVRDYIPVRKGNVGYLYDRVSGKLFGNAGTGDFVLGQDVVPVEYIESHGTEYIDTGIKLRSTDTINTRLYINSSSTSSWYGILGSRDSTRYLILRCVRGDDGIIGLYSSQTLTFSRYTWGSLSFTFGGDYHESGTSCYLFTYNNNGTAYSCLPYRFANFSITRDSSKIINFCPVRVGTDATSWEGAMMDVLTRRIYRNAGTGAFTYGNDLKYPIPVS